QVTIDKPAVGAVAELLVFLLPLAVLLALPAAKENSRLAVRRPAVKLGAVALLAAQFLGQDAPDCAVGLDDDGAPRCHVDVAPAGQVGAKFGVADQLVGWFVVGILGQVEPLLPPGRDGVLQALGLGRLLVLLGCDVLAPLVVVWPILTVVKQGNGAIP